MTPVLGALVVILALSSAVLLVCHRLRIPTVLGFLLVGIIAGPHGSGLVQATDAVEFMAELGVVLLLFTIGLEFSFGDLWRSRRVALGGGTVQVGLTVLAGFAAFRLGGASIPVAVFTGFFLALSSTAVVLRLLKERGELDSPHGRAVLGILILQDLLVVPMMLLIPVLAGTRVDSGEGIGKWSLRLLGVGGVVAVARWGAPRLLHQVVRTRDRELFALGVGVVCLAVAWLTHRAGLSLALGAFLAGVILAGSEFSHDSLGIALPFRHLFTSVFFVSVGMLIDVRFALEHWPVVLSLAFGAIVVKGFVAAGAIAAVGRTLRTAALAGLSLAQVGEFSFVLLQRASREALVGGETYQVLLAAALVTLAVAPFVIAGAPRAVEALERGRGLMPGSDRPGESPRPSDHVIVVGYGVGGRNVARAARICGIPYVVLESNPDTVREMRRRGEPIRFGDAVHAPSLEACGVDRARVMVVAISDPVSTRRVAALARRLNPAIRLIVRTRFILEFQELRRLGVNEIIAEEFEASIEVFTRVLAAYLVPRADIEGVVEEIRSEGYGMLRVQDPASFSLQGGELGLPGVEIVSCRVEAGAAAEGRTLASLELRRRLAVTALALKRGSDVHSAPPVDEPLRPGDLLILMGSPESLAGAAREFSQGEGSGVGRG